MTKPKPQMPLDELRRVYEDCLRTNLEVALEEGGMKRRIETLVDHASIALIAHTLGVRKDRWGRDEWEIEHRDSPLLRELGQHALEAAKRAVPGFVEQFAFKTAPKGMMKRLRSAYEDAYEKHMERLLHEVAFRNAMADIAQMEAVMRTPEKEQP